MPFWNCMVIRLRLSVEGIPPFQKITMKSNLRPLPTTYHRILSRVLIFTITTITEIFSSYTMGMSLFIVGSQSTSAHCITVMYHSPNLERCNSIQLYFFYIVECQDWFWSSKTSDTITYWAWSWPRSQIATPQSIVMVGIN